MRPPTISPSKPPSPCPRFFDHRHLQPRLAGDSYRRCAPTSLSSSAGELLFARHPPRRRSPPLPVGICPCWVSASENGFPWHPPRFSGTTGMGLRGGNFRSEPPGCRTDCGGQPKVAPRFTAASPRMNGIGAATIVLLTFLAYLPSLHGGFNLGTTT